MPRFFRLAAAIATAAVLVLSATTAQAAPGRAVANANVRSGPGSGYGVVDQLQTWEYVIVIKCTASWCLIHHIGPDGWVSRKLLVNPYYDTGSGRYEFAPKNGPGPGRMIGR